MKYWILFCLAALAAPVRGAEAGSRGGSAWASSVVTIEAARKQYDYYQPWSIRTRRALKTGVVVGERQILTTADDLFDRTLVRIQKDGRNRWWIAEVVWTDYYANLAMITVGDAEFWPGLAPAVLGRGIPEDGNLQIRRWREGKLENRRAEFTQCNVREGQLAAVSHVVIEADSDMLAAGQGEPLASNSHLLGLVAGQQGRACVAIPASFIRSVLEAREQGRYHGLGYFPFYWQTAENPASLSRLGLPGDPRGVLVVNVPEPLDGSDSALQPNDILLSIDGHEIDIQGDYDDPEFGRVMLENLATSGKWAGDELRLRIWRDRQEKEIHYRLPRYDYTNSLVAGATFDREPEYLIVGGLVFQPLTDSYLRSWGAEWKRRAPFRLLHYREEPAKRERPSLVILSQVLPDNFNIGYQEERYLVLDAVNGRKVSNLRELAAALAARAEGYHEIEFVRSDSLRKMVLAAGAAEREATARVLKRYGIAESSRLN